MFAGKSKTGKMKHDSKNLSDRQYYVDWLRILLITSVFLFHTGMIFVTWEWHVKNDVLYDGALRYTMSFLHIWRMPLLFMISGAGTFFALRGLSPTEYLAERSKRLLVPLAAGIFILVPVQVYVEKINSYNSLISFYPHIFDGIYPTGNFSWHHLWFIAYLFIISFLISPFLNTIRGKRFIEQVNRLTTFLSKPFALNLVIIPLLLSQLVLRRHFEKETHDLVNDWAYFTNYLLFFLAGLILLPRKQIVEAAVAQRRIYLAETIVFTTIMFSIPSILKSYETTKMVYSALEIIISWTCTVAVIGYAKKHLDFDSPLRKTVNEAIYPFYLLHQPLLVIMGYYFTRTGMADWIKALTIMSTSLFAFILIYRYLIRPYRITRIMFGMKIQRKKKTTLSESIQMEENEETRCA